MKMLNLFGNMILKSYYQNKGVVELSGNLIYLEIAKTFFMCMWYVSIKANLINPLVPNTSFLYPLKTSENLTVF